jgi:hypothetical protein
VAVTADDIIAGKIVCQLGLATVDVVRAALSSLDAQPGRGGPDVTVDLVSRGALDRDARTRVRRYVKLYAAVRRDAAYSAVIERQALVPKEKLDEAQRRAEEKRYEPRVGLILIELGELAQAQDERILGEVDEVLTREDRRVVDAYRREKFQGVARAITKDRNANLDSGQFTIKKLFRSKESQRLAKLAEQVRRESGAPPAPDRPTNRLQPFSSEMPTGRVGPPPGAGEATVQVGAFEHVGPYLLLRRLDHGGETQLHLARHPSRAKPVALRLYRLPTLPGGRFDREALACRLEHPNVVRVLEAAEAGSWAYIAHEYVPGETLAALIAREAPLAPERSARILRDVAAGLSALHEGEIVHGALETEAVLMATHTDGRPVARICHFREARLDPRRHPPGSGPLAVTLASAQITTVVSDLRSLGALLFEMATGEPAPDERSDVAPRSIAETRGAVLRVRGLPSSAGDVPASFEELAARLLSPDPADRPRNAKIVVQALDEIVIPSFTKGEDRARIGAAFARVFGGR